MPKSDGLSPNQPALQATRVDYTRGHLDEKDVASNPIEQFARWFSEARMSRPGEPNVMTLATADANGIPSARTLLLKDFDARGFTFFGNYNSQKARELEANPNAALVFFWHMLERQVRIAGTVAKVSRDESRAYYNIRPRDARIGAWASDQSNVISSRADLENAVKGYDAKFPAEVPLPDHWGGWRLSPTVIEFWQGGSARLHDRLRYVKQPDGTWKIERLAP
jgi:pyridoxamine 5'-phosphate oxidase